jgi:hypothetical protein
MIALLSDKLYWDISFPRAKIKFFRKWPSLREDSLRAHWGAARNQSKVAILAQGLGLAQGFGLAKERRLRAEQF